MQNKLVQVREADHGTIGYRYHFHQEKMTREAVTRTENDFQGRQGQHPQGQRLRRESPYVGNDIGAREGRRGIPEEDEGTAPTRTDHTQDSAPRAR